MRNKLVALSCIAWAAAAVSVARPAEAYFLLEEFLEDGTYVVVTTVWDYGYTQYATCDGEPFYANYLQLMVVDGVPTWVPTDTLYTQGRRQISLVRECGDDGPFVYGLGTCAC
jgi:hypothetical protein